MTIELSGTAPKAGARRSAGERRPRHSPRGGRWQRGFGAIVMLVLVAGAAAGAAMLAFSPTNALPLENDRKPTDALATAKEALIGYSVSRGAPACYTVASSPVCTSITEGQQNRPGMLPCPDLDGDGLEDKPCN